MAEFWDVYDKNRNKMGYTIERGKPMSPEEYHLVVQVWIRNPAGKWLISKRTPNKHYPLLWEPTGGSVLAGEDSLTGALRESREELGVELSPEKGSLFASFRRDMPCWENPGFLDVWVFEHDCSIESITLQEGETCGAMWAWSVEILRMIEVGEFVPMKHFPYCKDLFKQYQ